ncbi:transposase [Halomonas sp. H10-59]|uniref:transposase n=1 Tax=Halomonas sp. H10-59 TaxID=2950874 RepID=UPI0032B3EAE5
MMDEFTLHKGQRYATVVACADTQQVVWIGEGRSHEAIRPFFAWLGEAREQIEAVAMEMNSAFDLEVKDQCPNAEVVYDRFHVMAKYGREVMDRVRVDQANQLRDDKAARKIIKGSRWLLLRNANNLKPKQAVKLEELLAANASLTTTYLLKDQPKTLWFADERALIKTGQSELMKSGQTSLTLTSPLQPSQTAQLTGLYAARRLCPRVCMKVILPSTGGHRCKRSFEPRRPLG